MLTRPFLPRPLLPFAIFSSFLVFFVDAACPPLTELVYVFDIYESFHSPDDAALAQTVMGYWGSFARTGSPNAGPRLNGSLPSYEWPEFQAQTSEQRLELNVPLGVTNNLKSDKCDFWDTVQNDNKTTPLAVEGSLFSQDWEGLRQSYAAATKRWAAVADW